MKSLFALLTLSLTVSAFADVELTSKKLEVNDAQAVVVRTNKTPKSVEISFIVPLAKQVCERYETRFVMRTSEVECGADVRHTRVKTGTVCVHENPVTKECVRWGDTFREETTRIPRTCRVPEQYCVDYGTVTTTIRDTMKIEFKGLPALGDSESETFRIAGSQKNYDGSNVVYSVVPVKTLREYKVSQKKVLFWKIDSFVVEEK